MVRYIVLLISFIVVSVILFANPFNFPKEIKEAIVPWATLALAFVAIFTIVHSDVRERRGRTIGRLVDILDWVEDIIGLTHTIETVEPPILDDGNNTYEILKIKDEINAFNRERELGKHIEILAWRVEKALYIRVRSLTQAIDEMLGEDWTSPNLVDIRNQLNTHETRIYGMAKPLLDDIVRKIEQQ